LKSHKGFVLFTPNTSFSIFFYLTLYLVNVYLKNKKNII
jgi:hypothetical protein